jgi:integrase
MACGRGFDSPRLHQIPPPGKSNGVQSGAVSLSARVSETSTNVRRRLLQSAANGGSFGGSDVNRTELPRMAGGIKKVGNQKLTPRMIETWLSKHRAGKVKAFAKLTDGHGMYLTVSKGGTPVWRVKYRHGGKESTYSIGPYGNQAPAITLAAARLEREKVRSHLRDGRNPLQARDLERAAAVSASGNTFETVAREWLRQRRKQWSAIHLEKSERAIERDVLPQLGHLPVSEIRPAMVTGIVEAIASRGAVDTAGKIRQHVAGIFRLAQAKGLCDYKENPADPARELLPKKSQKKRRPALLKWTELGEVMRGAERARLTPAVRIAHRLCAFTAARISNAVQAEWREFDLDASLPNWIIPRSKMKAQDRAHDHKVFLGPTIAGELREWRTLSGSKGHVFPSPIDQRKHITRESLEKVYRVTLGLEDKHTPHGWRSALATLAREEGGFDRDVVELALDHIHDNDVVRAYDRGERLEQRIKLMAWWDAELTRAERGADVVPIGKKA